MAQRQLDAGLTPATGRTGHNRPTKRPASDDCFKVPVAKKPRVALAQISSPQNRVKSLRLPHHRVPTKTNAVPPSLQHHLALPLSQRLPKVTANRPAPPVAVLGLPPTRSVSKAVRDRAAAFQADSKEEDKPVSYPLDDYITNEELANLASLYGPVTESEQRTIYKTEFEAGFREFNCMYGHTKQIVKTFTKLERKLKAAGPSDVKAVKGEIYASYLTLKNDGEFMSQRAALFRLKQKLDHIRTMVEEYDRRIINAAPLGSVKS